MPGVQGFMYPNEMALQWSILIVLYPFITGLVAGAFILASLERVFNVQAVKPTYRLALLVIEIWLEYRRDIVVAWQRSSGVRRLVYRALALGSANIGEDALAVDDRVGHLITIVGIPSA